MIRLVGALVFLGLNFYTYYHLATNEVHPQRRPLFEFPLRVGDWRCPSNEILSEEIERNLGVTDYLTCVFQRGSDDAIVGAYIGYHASQVRKEGGGANETMIHPPAHCLPGSGWDIIDSRVVPMDLPGLPEPGARVNRVIVAKGEARQLVVYWYQERGRVIARDWEKIMDLFWDRATRSRTDGALVRFSAPIAPNAGSETAEAAIVDLARSILPELPAYVPN